MNKNTNPVMKAERNARYQQPGDVIAIDIADKALVRHALTVGIVTGVLALVLPEWPWMSHTWWVEFAVGLFPAAGKVAAISVLPAVTKVVLTTGMLLAIVGALHFLICVDAFFPRARKGMRNVNGRRFQIAWRGTMGAMFLGLLLLLLLYLPLFRDSPLSFADSHSRGQMFVASMTNSRVGLSMAAGTIAFASLVLWYGIFYVASLVVAVLVVPQRLNPSHGDQ